LNIYQVEYGKVNGKLNQGNNISQLML